MAKQQKIIHEVLEETYDDWVTRQRIGQGLGHEGLTGQLKRTLKNDLVDWGLVERRSKPDANHYYPEYRLAGKEENPVFELLAENDAMTAREISEALTGNPESALDLLEERHLKWLIEQGWVKSNVSEGDMHFSLAD